METGIKGRKNSIRLQSFHSVFVKIHVLVLSAIPHEVCFFTVHKSNELTKAKTAMNHSERGGEFVTPCDRPHMTVISTQTQPPPVSHIIPSLTSRISILNSDGEASHNELLAMPLVRISDLHHICFSDIQISVILQNESANESLRALCESDTTLDHIVLLLCSRTRSKIISLQCVRVAMTVVCSCF